MPLARLRRTRAGNCAAVPFSKESAAISPPTSPEPLPQSPYPEFGELTLQVSSASESGEVESVLPSRPTSPQSSQTAPSRTLSSIPTLRDTPPPELPRGYAPVLSGNTSPLPDPQRPQSWPLQIGRPRRRIEVHLSRTTTSRARSRRCLALRMLLWPGVAYRAFANEDRKTTGGRGRRRRR